METARRARHRLALPQGYELGSYQFQEQLGFGSFGITYLAYDQMLSRRVAIKELLPTMIVTRCDTIRVEPHTSEDEDQWQWAQERFVEEAQTVAVCEHPNVLHVFEAFRANGTAYMVTQFEEGCTLTQWLKRLGRAPSESELREILDPVLSALDTVHAHKVLHRDIKPDNIYMAQDNRPILIDFGSARQDVTHRSVPMTAIVTEGYAPFEQYSETGHQGPWTDLYALAAVMYSAIVGKKPPSAAERAAALDEDPCICLAATYADQYSAGLLESIDAGLRFNARSRPQNTEEWREILSGSMPQEKIRVPTGTPAGQIGDASGLAPTADETETPDSQKDWSFLPMRAAPSSAPSSSVPAVQSSRPRRRAYHWFLTVVLLSAATVVAVLVVKIKEKDDTALRENAAREAQMQDEREKEAAAIRAQAETADREKRISDEELQKKKKEIEQLTLRLKATPAPPPAAPVIYTPPPAPPKPAVDPATVATEAGPFVNSLGMQFVPAGTPGVLFCRTDTTRGLWRKFLRSSSYRQTKGMYVLAFDGQNVTWKTDRNAYWDNPGFLQTDDHPVVGVSWYEARNFCVWLGHQDGRSYRLPTDAEWSEAVGPKFSELAASVGGDAYPWGSSWPPPAGAGNYAGAEIRAVLPPNSGYIDGFSDGYAHTSPVGRFTANRYGLYDMGGNVWQWCEDEYRASMNDPDVLEEHPSLRNERATDGTPMRVLRGASWYSKEPEFLRSNFRSFDHPASRYDYYGFRVVLALPGR